MPRVAIAGLIQGAACAALLVLIVPLLGAHCKAINSYAGRYIVYTDAFYTCGKDYEWSWSMKTSHWNPARPNDLQRITGWMNGTVYNFTDGFWPGHVVLYSDIYRYFPLQLSVVMDARSNNMWKENAFVFKFPNGACSAIRKQIPEFYNVIFKRPRNEKTPCSVPPLPYVVSDQPIAWLFPNVPVMPYGMYRFRLTAGPTGKRTVACLVVECHVVPKLQQ